MEVKQEQGQSQGLSATPEGRERQDLDPVPHHRHLVQGGLSIEQHDVTVHQVPLHLRCVRMEGGSLGGDLKAALHPALKTTPASS